jgi:hypothetical protein
MIRRVLVTEGTSGEGSPKTTLFSTVLHEGMNTRVNPSRWWCGGESGEFSGWFVVSGVSMTPKLSRKPPRIGSRRS